MMRLDRGDPGAASVRVVDSLIAWICVLLPRRIFLCRLRARRWCVPSSTFSPDKGLIAPMFNWRRGRGRFTRAKTRAPLQSSSVRNGVSGLPNMVYFLCVQDVIARCVLLWNRKVFAFSFSSSFPPLLPWRQAETPKPYQYPYAFVIRRPGHPAGARGGSLLSPHHPEPGASSTCACMWRRFRRPNPWFTGFSYNALGIY